jgi:two-component system, NtrC family, sensor histidine kinase HupT/HoxJ
MAAYETQGFKLDNSGKRVVVDPVTRIEGHLRVEVNLDDKNTIRNAVSTGTMWRGLEVILKGRDPRDAWAAELEQQQRFIMSLLLAMSDVLVAINGEGLIEETNAALCELVGRGDDELRGTPLARLVTDEVARARLRHALQTVLSERSAATVEIELVDAQGQRVPVDFNCTARRGANGRRAGHVLVGRPLGEIKRAYVALREAHEALKRTQVQLLRSKKMASLGRLVAGVAHELNNPISFVLGNVAALQKYGDRLTQYLGAVHAGTRGPELDALRRSLRIDAALADLPSALQGMQEGAQRTADIVAGLKRFSAVDR